MLCKVDRCGVRSHGTESYDTKGSLLCLKNVESPIISLSDTFMLYATANVKPTIKGYVCSEFRGFH